MAKTNEILSEIVASGGEIGPEMAPLVTYCRQLEDALEEVLAATESPASYLRCKAALDRARELLEGEYVVDKAKD